MKKELVLCLVFILAVATAFADDGSVVGGSGGPEVVATELGGSFAGLSGGCGRVTIGRTVSIGGGGYVHALPIGGVPADAGDRLSIAYGGFIVGVEVPLFGCLLVGSELMLGGGSATAGDGSEPTHRFYVVEPEVRLHIALLEWMRLSVGAGYRFILGFDGNYEPGAGDLSGLVVPIGVRFGSF